MTTPALVSTFEPLIVRNSLETTSVGRSSRPSSALGVPPREPSPLRPSSMEGQMTEWKTMLSLPMK